MYLPNWTTKVYLVYTWANMYLVFLYDCRLSTYKNLNCTLDTILKSQAIVLPMYLQTWKNTLTEEATMAKISLSKKWWEGERAGDPVGGGSGSRWKPIAEGSG